MQPTILAIIGKPLAGKDTQADLLVAAYKDSVKISTGHIIRAVREEGETHRFWPLIGPYIPLMEQGIKLPDGPIIEMITRVAKEQVLEGKKLIIVAGSPRSFEQLDGFKQMAEDTNATLHIVCMEVTDEETFLRSSARKEGRTDDTPEVHAVRLEEYRTHVIPMVEKLYRESQLTQIDGMKSKEVVFAMLECEVNKRIFDPEITLPAMARR